LTMRFLNPSVYRATASSCPLVYRVGLTPVSHAGSGDNFPETWGGKPSPSWSTRRGSRWSRPRPRLPPCSRPDAQGSQHGPHAQSCDRAVRRCRHRHPRGASRLLRNAPAAGSREAVRRLAGWSAPCSVPARAPAVVDLDPPGLVPRGADRARCPGRAVLVAPDRPGHGDRRAGQRGTAARGAGGHARRSRAHRAGCAGRRRRAARPGLRRRRDRGGAAAGLPDRRAKRGDEGWGPRRLCRWGGG
jgi:hypothetical protein